MKKLVAAVMKKTALALPLILALLVPSAANAEFVRSYSSYDPHVNYTHFFLTVYSPTTPTSEDWNEVARFTGSGYQQYYTDYFTCDYREWRIRWEYVSEPDSAGFAYFNVVVYPERALFVVDSILSKGGNDTNGISYIHDMSGRFFMGITAGAAESYTIIVEQNLNSIPEFPSLTPLLTVPVLFAVALVIYRRKLSGRNVV